MERRAAAVLVLLLVSAGNLAFASQPARARPVGVGLADHVLIRRTGDAEIVFRQAEGNELPDKLPVYTEADGGLVAGALVLRGVLPECVVVARDGSLRLETDGMTTRLCGGQRHNGGRAKSALSAAIWPGSEWVPVVPEAQLRGSSLTSLNDFAFNYSERHSFTTTGCSADWDQSGTVNSADISAFLTAWLLDVQTGGFSTDFDCSGAVNSSDISAHLTAWLSQVESSCGV